MKRLIRGLFLLAVLMPEIGSAHPFHGADGSFVMGFLHPFTGMDHLLAMLAVGMLAMRSSRSTSWYWPASFLVMAAVGFWWGMSLGNIPSLESMLAVSVVILGAMLANGLRGSLSWLPMIALFGLMHGLAHGVELNATEGAMACFAGFLMATALLQASGMGLVLILRQPAQLRLCGAGMAAIGLLLLAS